VIQIIGEDTLKDVILIINWDIKKNQEVNMFQINCEQGTFP
jgi:hypothetical protein